MAENTAAAQYPSAAASRRVYENIYLSYIYITTQIQPLDSCTLSGTAKELGRYRVGNNGNLYGLRVMIYERISLTQSVEEISFQDASI